MMKFIVEKEREMEREFYLLLVLPTTLNILHWFVIANFSMKFHFMLSVFPVNKNHPKHTYSNRLMNSL